MTVMFDMVELNNVGGTATLIAFGLSHEDARALADTGHRRGVTTREMARAVTELFSGIDFSVYPGTFAEYITEIAEGCKRGDPDALFDLEVDGLIPTLPIDAAELSIFQVYRFIGL